MIRSNRNEFSQTQHFESEWEKNSLIQPFRRCCLSHRRRSHIFELFDVQILRRGVGAKLNKNKYQKRKSGVQKWHRLGLSKTLNRHTPRHTPKKASGTGWYCYHTSNPTPPPPPPPPPNPPPSWQKKSPLKRAKLHITQQFPDANVPLQPPGTESSSSLSYSCKGRYNSKSSYKVSTY